MYLHLSKKSACANALAPLYGWREGGPMQYCLIHRTTAHTSKSLLDPGKGQFVLNGNLIKSQDFSTTRAFKLCGVCIYWPLFASEGTITCLRSQKPEIELCFLNSQGKGSFQNLIAVLEKQYKWPRNWLAIKNTGHTVTFESQMNSEQNFFFFYHKYIPCSIWDILIPKKMYLKFTLIACPAFYLETLPRIELLEHKDVCNLRTTCMFCLTTSGSSIHFLKFGDWVGGGLIFFFFPPILSKWLCFIYLGFDEYSLFVIMKGKDPGVRRCLIWPSHWPVLWPWLVITCCVFLGHFIAEVFSLGSC